MKYIIMADGKGKRWNYYNDIPKHFIKIDGETLIERTIRLLKEYDENSEIIITSHDERYEIKGTTRYEPKNNKLEIDRYTYELIDEDVCFLYGDTYYTDESLKKIVSVNTDDVIFFGNIKKIVGVKIKDPILFKEHLQNVRKLFLEGKISNCIGWQLYQSVCNLKFDKIVIKDKFVQIDDETLDFNTPSDYHNYTKVSK